MHKIALGIVVAYIVLAIGWDIVCGSGGTVHDNSFCQACRELNRTCDGLFALCSVALWLHVFCLPWLPAFWKHFQP